ncbi:MAG: VWA domain-containing protein [Acidobacteriota bacterium]|nr:VWA domain-containing protein [Acidobacteriota bacterium]
MKTCRHFAVATVLLALVLPGVAQNDAPDGAQNNTQDSAPQSNSQGNPPAVYTQKTEEQKGDPQPTFKVDVKLVNVYVTVTDAHGAPVGGLVKDDFRLAEDGVPQDIRVFAKESELPLSIVLAVDSSLSVRTSLKLELESARRFIHEIMRRQDALSLYQFSEQVDELVHFTSDLRTIDRGIDRVHVGSATALFDAVFLASEALAKRQGRKVLVVITDGGDTMSQVDYQQALRAAQESEAIIYSIIVVPIESSAGRNTGGEHALIQFSEDTGGRYYYAKSLPELDKVFRQISEQLRTQYLLGFYPKARQADSDFRRLAVTLAPAPAAGGAAADDLNQMRARHRTGYYISRPH